MTTFFVNNLAQYKVRKIGFPKKIYQIAHLKHRNDDEFIRYRGYTRQASP